MVRLRSADAVRPQGVFGTEIRVPEHEKAGGVNSMVTSPLRHRILVVMLAVSCGLTTLQADAAKRSKPIDKAKNALKTIEMFSGMSSGALDVKFIPQSSKSANVLITNKSDAPLRIELPSAFAGVPIHRQMGMGGMGGMGGGMGGMGGGMGGMGGGMGGQGMGGGMGGMGGGMGGMGGGMGGMGGMGGGGMFNLEPGKVRKIHVTTVCLEHGKPEPRPKMKYKIIPIRSFTQDAQVVELCKMVGTGKISQTAAQAAAWHITDGLTWEQLANKIGIKHLNGMKEPFFSSRDIQLGMQIAALVARHAETSPVYKDEKADSMSRH